VARLDGAQIRIIRPKAVAATLDFFTASPRGHSWIGECMWNSAMGTSYPMDYRFDGYHGYLEISSKKEYCRSCTHKLMLGTFNLSAESGQGMEIFVTERPDKPTNDVTDPDVITWRVNHWG
jgi:hypothetical protein